MDGADPAAVTSSRLGFMLQRLTTEHQPPQDEARWSRPSDGNYASSSIHTTPALASKARRWNSQHGASIRTKPRHCVCGPLTQLPAGTKGKAGIKLKYKGHFPHSPSLFSIHQPFHNSFVVSYISVFHFFLRFFRRLSLSSRTPTGWSFYFLYERPDRSSIHYFPPESSPHTKHLSSPSSISASCGIRFLPLQL
jgi:hypothetical protein